MCVAWARCGAVWWDEAGEAAADLEITGVVGEVQVGAWGKGGENRSLGKGVRVGMFGRAVVEAWQLFRMLARAPPPR